MSLQLRADAALRFRWGDLAAWRGRWGSPAFQSPGHADERRPGAHRRGSGLPAPVMEFNADNPGEWLVHCHNLYHAEAGMESVLSYVK